MNEREKGGGGGGMREGRERGEEIAFEIGFILFFTK